VNASKTFRVGKRLPILKSSRGSAPLALALSDGQHCIEILDQKHVGFDLRVTFQPTLQARFFGSRFPHLAHHGGVKAIE
jgi:hypothetical protein